MERFYQITIKLIESFISVMKVILMSKFYKTNNPTPLRDSIKICGNGPSFLKNLDEKINFESDYMTVNHLPKTSIFETIKPTYHILTAPEFFLNHSNEKQPIYDIVFDALVEKVKWPITVVVSSRLKKNHPKIEYLKSNPHIAIYSINLTPVEGLSFIIHKLFNYGLGMPRPHNVLIPSIMLSIRLGYKNIYLLGADHSWLKDLRVDEKNNALLNQKHFYDEKISKEKPMLMHAKRPRLLHQILHKFYLSFKAYHEIKEYADKKGVSIYNCTKDSFIDAFEKI